MHNLQELENAATADADVREKISNLPKEVSDTSYLNNLEGLLFNVFLYIQKFNWGLNINIVQFQSN